MPHQPIINEALLTEYDSLLAKLTSVPQISPLTIESHFAMNELERALTDAERWTEGFCLLEVRLGQLDRSPALDRLAARLAKRL